PKNGVATVSGCAATRRVDSTLTQAFHRRDRAADAARVGGTMQQPQGGTMQTPQAGMMQSPQAGMMQGGHLYTQTNQVRNSVIHSFRAPDGTIAEVERVFTGGAGSGTFKPVSGQESAPNAFEGANSVIVTPDRRFLFATNGGDNSVSSFALGV